MAWFLTLFTTPPQDLMENFIFKRKILETCGRINNIKWRVERMLKIYKYTQIVHTWFARSYPDLRHRHAGFAKQQTRDELKAKKQLDPMAIKVDPYGNEFYLNKQQFFVEFLCAIIVLKTRGRQKGPPYTEHLVVAIEGERNFERRNIRRLTEGDKLPFVIN